MEPPGRRPPGSGRLPGRSRRGRHGRCAAAAASGLKVAPQGTGHGAPPLAGRLGDAVLLRTSAMTELRVDAASAYGAGRRRRALGRRRRPGRPRRARRPAHVQPGRRRRRLVARRRAELVRPPARPAVQRDHGRRAGARRRHVRARHRDRRTRDLLWAARGGGGGFGVVTALEFDLLPVRDGVRRDARLGLAHAQRVLTAWGEWAAEAPESVTSVARLFQAPDVDVAARRRPRPAARHASTPSAGGRCRGGCPRCSRRCGRCGPRSTRSTRCPRADVAHLQLDPQEPTAVYANSVLVDGLPDRRGRGAGRDGRPRLGQSDLLFVELRQLGGALSRPAPRGGALDRMDGSFLVLGVGLDVGAGWSAVREDATPGHGRRSQPWATESVVPPRWPTRTSTSGAAGRPRPGSACVGIRAAADPHGLFVPPRAAAKRLIPRSAQVGAQVRLKAPGSTVVASTTTPRPGGTHDHRTRPAPRRRARAVRGAGRPHAPAPSPCPATRRTTPSSRRGTSPSRCGPRPSSPRRPPRTSSRPCASRPGTACA